jgi:hypothetical protein
MDCNPIIQRDNSQNSSLKLLDSAPKPIAVPLLRLASQWLFQNLNAPFLLQIGTFTQNFVLEIFREPVLWHCQRIARFRSHD